MAIDTDERYLVQAQLTAETEGYVIVFCKMSIYDIEGLGETCDLVVLMGLYRLRHSLLAPT